MNTFDKTKHEYRINGQPVLSVTQILKEAGLIDSTWFTPEAAERGTFVHTACALYDRENLDFERLDERLVPYVSAWTKFRKDSGIVPTIIETQYFSAKHGFAGTVDRLWFNGKHIVVGDLKSGALPSWLPIQLGGYSLLTNALIGMGIELRDNGKYSVKVVKTQELFKARRLFLEFLAIVKKRRMEHGKEDKSFGRRETSRSSVQRHRDPGQRTRD